MFRYFLGAIIPLSTSNFNSLSMVIHIEIIHSRVANHMFGGTSYMYISPPPFLFFPLPNIVNSVYTPTQSLVVAYTG